MVNIIIKGSSRKPRRKQSNAGDARDVVQEARETGMSQKEYFRRMNEVCRDTPGDKCKDLLKARTEHDLPFRKEKGW